MSAVGGKTAFPLLSLEFELKLLLPTCPSVLEQDAEPQIPLNGHSSASTVRDWETSAFSFKGFELCRFNPQINKHVIVLGAARKFRCKKPQNESSKVWNCLPADEERGKSVWISCDSGALISAQTLIWTDIYLGQIFIQKTMKQPFNHLSFGALNRVFDIVSLIY